MTTGHNMFFISLQFGTWRHNCQAVQPPPHICTVSD